LTFCTYDQVQPMLLVPDIWDWLVAGHGAGWVDALVEGGMEVSPICDVDTDVRGGLPYDPWLMVKMVFYGYFYGLSSLRVRERRCHDDIAFGFLTAQQAPDFVAISSFLGLARAGV
jgi:hypothetical protein